MQVLIEKPVLMQALGHVQSVVERRNTIPILSNVLLKTQDHQLKLMASDLDIEITEIVPAQTLTHGSATVSAHILYDIVRKLPEGSQIEIEQGPDSSRLLVKSGRSRFSLQALLPEDFPDLTIGAFTHNFVLSSTDLRNLIEKTRSAISTEETRYYLNGIYFHEADDGKVLRAVATDGHRLAQSEIALPEQARGMAGIIVPRKTVLEIIKLIDGLDCEVALALSPSKMQLSVGHMVLTSKLIDGTFPDYKRVIPQDNDKKLVVDTKIFAAAIDRVSAVSIERGRAVKLNLSADRLVLSVNHPEQGSAEEEISVQYDREPLEIGFNARYLLDILGFMKSEKICLDLADQTSPCVIYDAAEKQSLCVLMPMRV